MKWIVIVFLIFSFGMCDEHEKESESFHIPRDLSYLNLTKNQTERLKKVLKEYKKVLKELHKKEEREEKVLEKIFLKNSFDKEAFYKKNLTIKREIVKIETNFFAKFHSILDKKQREKFIKYFEEWEIE